MLSKSGRIVATAAAGSLFVTGLAAQELIVRQKIGAGEAVVVSTPVGSCALRGVDIRNGRATITVTYTDLSEFVPGQIELLTGRGHISTLPHEGGARGSGKGGPGI